MASALTADRDGPLWRALWPAALAAEPLALADGEGKVGFVTYRSLDGYGGASLDDLIARTVDYFADQTDVAEFEWKTRGHDRPVDLGARLVAHGLQPQDAETVMMGEAGLLTSPGEVQASIRLRRLGQGPSDDLREDVERMMAMLDEAFGTERRQSTEELVRRIAEEPERIEAWVAEDTGTGAIVAAGRLEIDAGTDFAGLWGGGTLPRWRGRGIYRALTAARAQSAVSRGVRYLYSDCTEHSRPILERSGMVAVTTTTPYLWQRLG